MPRIKVLPEEIVHVRVVDELGRFVPGVPVKLMSEEEIGHPLITETSGAEDGSVTFRRVGLLARAYKVERLSVALGVPLAEEIKAILDPAKLPNEPIELVERLATERGRR